MIFEEDEGNNNNNGQENLNHEIAKALKDQEINPIGNNNLDTIKFSCLVNLFNKLSTLRSRKKSDYLKSFLKLLFKNNRKPEFTYSVLRLLLPAEDRQRGNYGVKQKNLAIIVKDCFNLTKEQYERLKHFKNPNYHQGGVGIGDFAICLYDVIKGVCNRTSHLTVKELNEILDEMAAKDTNEEKTQIFRKLYRLANAQQIKWIARIILKDLKLSIKVQFVLNTFHPDGNDYYNLTNSVKQTCKKLQSLETSLNDDIALFHPIRPMLAGKKNMKYFQQTSQQKQYFVQTKFDGERLQVHIDKGQIKVFSRNGVDYNHVYQCMFPIFKDKINCDSCILDGEIIVMQKSTKNIMPFGLNKVVALGQDTDMQLCYKIFDILWVKKDDQDINLMSYPLKERKKILQKAVVQVPGKLQVVQFQVLSKYEDIQQAFKESMQRNEEGLMLKDPQSPYVPKQRAMNWMKMKGDYVEGLTDTLDLIILGGYFGNLSYRVGPGGHWSDKITTFLLGVIQRIDPENPKVAYAVPFCKVGTGYTGDQLQQLRSQLRKNLILNDGNKKPSYLSGNWKPKLQDRPDCYINFLYNSRILEVKGAQLISSEAFGAPVTLRFPRVVAIRYDKDWNEALKLQQLTNMQNDQKYTKNIRRKKAGSQSEEQNKQEQDRTKKKFKQQKLKKNNQILDQFRCANLSQEKVKSHLFTDMQFFVFQLQGGLYSKHDVEKAIMVHNGRVVQNPMITTEFVVADRIDFKLRLLEKNQQKSFTFIKPQYIFNCIKSQVLIPLSPIYLTVLPIDKQQYYRQNFDKFGDSYTTYLNRRQLDQILKEMERQNEKYPQEYQIDRRLEQKLTLKKRRTGKRSLCFGIDEIQILKLRVHGNSFVNNFSDEPNSIIIGRNVPDLIVKKINSYLYSHENVEVQPIKQLYDSMIIA